jgi:DNA-binding transcriptional LysR family regulator
MVNASLRQLRAFTLVAREKSFTRAADRLHVSPSALTIAIKELETEVGLRLFDRTTRTVALTQQAVAFLPVAERLLDEIGRALEDLRSVAERKKGLVIVAASASAIASIIAPAIGVLTRDHPEIAVRVFEDTTESIAERVLNGEVDYGITTLVHPIEGIAEQLLLRDRVGVIMSSRHRLAKEEGPLAVADVGSNPVIALMKGAGIRDLVAQQPMLAKLLSRPTVEVSNASILFDFVARNVGIAFASALALRIAPQRNIAYRPLESPVIMREVYFLRARNRMLSPAATALAERVLMEIRRLRLGKHIEVEPGVEIRRLVGTT